MCATACALRVPGDLVMGRAWEEQEKSEENHESYTEKMDNTAAHSIHAADQLRVPKSAPRRWGDTFQAEMDAQMLTMHVPIAFFKS